MRRAGDLTQEPAFLPSDTSEGPCDFHGGKPCEGSGTDANLRAAREVEESQRRNPREGDMLGI